MIRGDDGQVLSNADFSCCEAEIPGFTSDLNLSGAASTPKHTILTYSCLLCFSFKSLTANGYSYDVTDCSVSIAISHQHIAIATVITNFSCLRTSSSAFSCSFCLRLDCS